VRRKWRRERGRITSACAVNRLEEAIRAIGAMNFFISSSHHRPHNKSTHLIFHRPQKTTEYGKARLEDLDLIIQNCGIVDKEGGVVINER
jgi:hypothetical protein